MPRRRLTRRAIADAHAWRSQPGSRAAAGTRAYASWDEDSITLAVEACRRATAGAAGIGRLALASTTLPFADRSNAGLVAGALLLDEHVPVQDLAGSQRAGTSGLAALLGSGATGPALLVGAERRPVRAGSPQEAAYGDAAAAVVVGEGPVLAEFLGAESLTADFVDHYREAGAESDYAFEERWVRAEGHAALVPRAVAPLLARAQVAPAAIRHFLFAAPPAVSRRLAASLGIDAAAVADPLFDRIGDTGVAHPLVMLAAALETAQAGDLILLLGFGQGVDAILFRAAPDIAARVRPGVAAALAAGVEDTSYVRFLAHAGLLELDWGMRAERDNRTAQTAYWRRHRDLTGFTGGRCRACGTVQFPRSRACVNPECRAFDTQDEARLADLGGQVKTFTEDWLAYSPAPPFVYGNVALTGGGNVFIDFTDVDPGEVAVGATVRFVFRIKDVDRARGFRRYFWKATPGRA